MDSFVGPSRARAFTDRAAAKDPGGRAVDSQTAVDRLHGRDPAFRRAIDMALRAAATDCSVLVVGETGTGKELVARAVHEASSRAEMPLVAVNCGAIPGELIGSELFGHERGAFTGAAAGRDGVFVQAHHGSLFLDELGELPLDQQPHLLRVLETRTVRRLGGHREEPVDVRVLAATNRLDALGTARSTLRLDLYHRLATVVVHLPPLRERPGDIEILCRAFMAEMAADFGPREISPKTLAELSRYPWPGNIRELRQAVKRAMTLCPSELTSDVLVQPPPGAPDAVAATRPRSRHRRGPCVAVDSSAAVGLRPIDLIIREALLDALDKHTSIRRASRSLGLAKSTFADWAKRLGIELGHSTSTP